MIVILVYIGFIERRDIWVIQTFQNIELVLYQVLMFTLFNLVSADALDGKLFASLQLLKGGFPDHSEFASAQKLPFKLENSSDVLARKLSYTISILVAFKISGRRGSFRN